MLKRLLLNLLNHLPLRVVLVVPFVLLMGCTAFLIGALALHNGQRAVSDVTQQLRTELGTRVEQHLKHYLAVPVQVNETLHRYLQLAFINHNDVDILAQMLWQQVHSYPSLSYIQIGTAQGEFIGYERRPNDVFHIERANPHENHYALETYQSDSIGQASGDLIQFLPTYDPRQQPWYQHAATGTASWLLQLGKSEWTEIYYFLGETPWLSMTYTMPLYDATQQLQGVIASALSLQDINQFLQSLQVGQQGQIFIMDTAGFLIASSTPTQLFEYDHTNHMRRIAATASDNQMIQVTAQQLISADATPNLAELDNRQHFEFKRDGVRQLVEVLPFGASQVVNSQGLAWFIVITVPETDFMQQIAENNRITVWLSLAAVILMLIIGLLVSRWVVQPILSLNRAAKQLADGHYRPNLPIKRQDELGELAQTFEHMADWLQASFDALGDKNEQLIILNQQLLDHSRTLSKKVAQRTAALAEQKQEADRLREAAERASEAKTRFLAAASHDLRQPLHALSLFTEALHQRAHEPEVQTLVNKIRQSLTTLGDLLNGLLDISRLDAAVVQPNIHTLALTEIARKLEHELMPQAVAKGLALEFVNCDFYVQSDPLLLERVLRNLVGNAIKYTEQGQVKFWCQRSQADPAAVEINVTDTGIGIPVEQQPKIFAEFYQINNPERDRSKGLGLGLCIVKRLVDLLQHEIKLVSFPNEGSIFTVLVPISPSEAIQQRLTSHTGYSDDKPVSGCILLVDDEQDIRESTELVLQDWGHEVLVADSLDQALMQLEKRVPEVLIVDYRLREGSTGLQVIAAIHMIAGQEIPAILLTGDIAPESLKEIKAAGHRVLHKPVKPAKLRSLLNFYLQTRAIT